MTRSRGIRAKRVVWTDVQTRQLRDLYPDLQAQTVATEIGVPVSAVYRKANQLGLRKSADFLASDRSKRIQRGHQTPAMVANRFQKGFSPWNKGTKGVAGQHENSRATQFKKGDLCGAARHNYVAIGTHRLSKEGYLERKVTDDPALAPARRWVAVHRLVWQEANGPIPRGQVIVFRPGTKTANLQQITSDRLECITRAALAQRNHPRTKSPELAKLVQLKGAITRQVNRINREAREAST